MNVAEGIREVCEAFREGLKDALGEKLVGVYLYGALTFPETQTIGDIDFHVILAGPLTDVERTRLYRMHDALARDFRPLGGEMDGYYILLAEARRPDPPRSEMWRRAVDYAWAPHRRHIHAGRCIVLHGPDPKAIYPPATWSEIEKALDAEGQFVADHLDEHPDYCFLQLCRLMYTFRTRDVVVSKASAASWACQTFPQWRGYIQVAKDSYARLTDENRAFLLSEVRAFHRFACEQIEQSRAAKWEGLS